MARSGGLNAIVAKLQQAGFGDQVKSWLGNGQNLPITAEQLQQVLGSDTVKQLAARFNIPVDQLSKVLAQQLPAAVDHASPNGKLPQRLSASRTPVPDLRGIVRNRSMASIALKNLQNPCSCDAPMQLAIGTAAMLYNERGFSVGHSTRDRSCGRRFLA